VPNHFYPVILAGGRGTRFWPLSRRRGAKQVLALDGPRTMIQQTAARLGKLAPPRNFWVITNQELRPLIRRQLPRTQPRQIIAEPAGRNTAPAIGLAAFILLRRDPAAVIGMFPSDQVVRDEEKFRNIIAQAATIAAAGENMVVLGIRPTRPETGYGYIESSSETSHAVLRVRRFTEKPDSARAAQFLAAGNYFWNSGMYIWSAATLVSALREYLPETAKLLEQIAETYGTSRFEKTFRHLYPRCQNISVDYALAEPRSARGEDSSNLFCIPTDVGWGDLGSWAALYEHRAAALPAGGNVIQSAGSFALDASGNFLHSPHRFVAAVGVKDLVVVDSGDALLITTRDRAQDVGKVVKHLEENKRNDLL